MEKSKVMLALSGGVDSSVCIEILKDRGYEVHAVVMKMSDAHEDTVEAAKEVAGAFDIPITVLDLRDIFKEKVIIPFAKAYMSAKTPNPCIVCNPGVKFKYLLSEADRHGCAHIATGHYAGVGFENGRYFIKKAFSAQRDQSYMLYRLSQNVLSRLILPLSDFEKSDVRAIANELSLSSANAPDSQENCFIPDNDYAAYIENMFGKAKRGFFISPEGERLCEHKGIIHYTVGQRKGLNIALGKPVFISKIDASDNSIYLAYAGGDFKDRIEAEDCVFMSVESICKETAVTVKIRSAAPPAKAVISPLENGNIAVEFENAVKAPASGQSAVFYDGDKVLGGGFIV